jgi:surface protein
MVMDRLCAHALAGSCCGLGLQPETLNRASPCPSASTACGFGAQAFYYASAFNANIGAWNTASVSNMELVCAARGPPARTTADALGRGSVLLGRLCAAAPPMRAFCAHVQALALRGALGVGTAARRGGSVHAFEYIYVCASVCSALVHTVSIYLYM